MKQTRHKILSVFLSFCMIISCMVGMSVTASAAAYATYLVESTDTSDTLPNKVVHFNSKDWYIIKDESTAVNTGTVTLLAADTSFGVSEFHNSNNTYSTSTIKSNLDTLTTTGTFKDVADAIKDTENGKLYILSIDETQQLSSNVLKINFSGGDCSSGEWWLRSPDPNSPNYAGHAAIVIGNSGEISGANIGWEYGVRPALQLDLSKVTFDSETKTFTVKSTPSTAAWENGNVIGILDGTKLTVAKKDGAATEAWGTVWQPLSPNTTEWDSVKENITEVEIQDSVTSIGRNAFYNCTALTSVDIPSTVTSIGNKAFQDCLALTSVTIPSGVTSIGSDAFYECKSLKSVTIPSSVTSIGYRVFGSCSSLTSVTIPSSVTSIGSGAFGSCSSLTSVEIPSSVTSIGSYAFNFCSSLTSVTIPGSVTSIGNNAFANCSNLATVTFEPRSAADINSGNTSLSIGRDAFTGTANGAKVAYGTGNAVLYDGENPINAGDALTKIYSTTEGKTLTWKAPSAKAWTNGNVIGILDGTKLTVAKKDGAQNGDMGDGWQPEGSAGDWTDVREKITEVEIQDGVTSISKYAFSSCTAITSIDIPSTVTSIGNAAFAWCSALTSVTIPSGVTSIGNNAFQECLALTSVDIPSSVTSIGSTAFYYCSALTSVTIPGSVTSIGEGAFNRCSSLESVTIPGSVTSIGSYAFYDCTSLTSVTFEPVSETEALAGKTLEIGGYAFYDIKSDAKLAYGTGDTVLYDGENEIKAGTLLTDIHGKTLTWKASSSTPSWTNGNVIGILDGTKLTVAKKDGAQNGDMGDSWQPDGSAGDWTDVREKITEVEIQDSVTSIGNNAFLYCPALTSVDIPSTVTSIGNVAFAWCSALTSVTIPSSVTSIGNNAFIECLALTSVDIPSSVTSIGKSAFYNCESLTSVTIPSSVTSIGWNTFKGCSSLESVTIPGSVTSIGDNAFEFCSSLESVTIPGSVTSIGDNAFYSCSNLATVTFEPVSETDAIAGKTLAIGADAFTHTANGIGGTVAYGTGSTVLYDGENEITTDTRLTVIQGKTLTWKGSTGNVNPYIPSYAWTGTTTTAPATTAADEPAETMTFEGEETISHTNLLSWSSVPGASSYLLSVKTDGKFVPLAATTKTNIDIVHANNGKYYVSEGGKYTAYTYKDGKFVKDGTITAAQADKLVKANNVTDTYMLQYTKNGKLSSDKTAPTVSVKVYYKPAVKITANKGSIMLRWNKVPGATKYRVYKYVNNNLKLVTETTKNAVLITGTKAGKEYSYAVKAYVDGKWTKVYKSDIVTVTAK